MDATVQQLGDVVIEALRAAGYMDSTIGHCEKTIRYLTGFVASRGGLYTPALGAAFAAMTTSPRTGRFSAQRRFDYRRLVTLFDGYLATGMVDLAMRTRGGGGPRPVSEAFTALDAAWGGGHVRAGPGTGHPQRLRSGRARLPGVLGVTRGR